MALPKPVDTTDYEETMSHPAAPAPPRPTGVSALLTPQAMQVLFLVLLAVLGILAQTTGAAGVFLRRFSTLLFP